MNRKGFTLIELLLVIAILGVLAVIVLVALNPLQQIARARDAGRLSTVAQLGHALEAYAVSNNGVYVTQSATWIDTMKNVGEVSNVPSQIAYLPTSGVSTPCSTSSMQNGWCYKTGTAGAIVYARLESLLNAQKCSTGNPYALYSTAQGRGGIHCNTSEPTVSASISFQDN